MYSMTGVVTPPLEGQTLYDMGRRLLELTVDIMHGAGAIVPERQLVYMAPIPADCEQVAVLFSGWTPYPQQEGPSSCSSYQRLAGFSVIITRKSPAVQTSGSKSLTPTPDKMLAAAELASNDAEMLLQVLQAVPTVSNPSVTTQSPYGGLQTVELNLDIPAGALW